jgi:predicted hydrocarbon binding protein
VPVSYASQEKSRIASPVPALTSDPFGAALLSLLDDAADIASERVWQEIPKLIARQWSAFSQYQSPLSTMGMISRAAETVLKIRLASRRGGGEEESRRLEEFQALMADIWGTGEVDVAGSEETPRGDK